MIAEGKKIEQCHSYLTKNKFTPLTDKFFYKEKDGEITAVAGLILCTGKTSCFARIEPMHSDNGEGFELYNEIMEYLKSFEVAYVMATTGNIKLQSTLEKLGWKIYTKNFTEYIKKIT